MVRHADLVILALALPAFLIAGWPMLGYAVIAAAWLAQAALQTAAERRSARALAEGDRRSALGLIAGSTLGRVWLVTISILLVGGLAEREDGLAAALLGVVLVTASLAGRAFARLMEPGEPSR
ncbi:MAG: hypothetical protein U0R52_09050 [Solirubrobacterales bacterium]